MKDKVYSGKVVWFSPSRGFGFVAPDDKSCNDGKDLFIHYSNIRAPEGKFKTVQAGASVSFTIGTNDNGPQAENIDVLEDEVKQ